MRHYLQLFTLLSALIIIAPCAKAGSQDKVDLNQANKTQLQNIKGIGQYKASNIVRYRQQHGSFQTIDELAKVTGFGQKTINELKSNAKLTLNQDKHDKARGTQTQKG